MSHDPLPNGGPERPEPGVPPEVPPEPPTAIVPPAFQGGATGAPYGYPGAVPGFPPDPSIPEPPRKRFTTPVVVSIIAVIVVAILCVVCGAVAVTRLNKNNSDAGLDIRPTPIMATAPAIPATAPTPKMTPPKRGPVAGVPGDGTWLVGVDVKAGEYRAWVPETSILCYWERLKGTSGEFADLIVNGETGAGSPAVVTIANTDRAFRSRGCGAWAPVSRS